MAVFNIGDIVEVVSFNRKVRPSKNVIGRVGTIRAIDRSFEVGTIGVEFPDDIGGHRGGGLGDYGAKGHCWNFDAEDLERVRQGRGRK